MAEATRRVGERRPERVNLFRTMLQKTNTKNERSDRTNRLRTGGR